MCTDTTSRAPDRGTDEIPNASPTPRICSESNGLADSGSTFLLVVTTWASPGPAPRRFKSPPPRSSSCSRFSWNPSCCPSCSLASERHSLPREWQQMPPGHVRGILLAVPDAHPPLCLYGRPFWYRVRAVAVCHSVARPVWAGAGDRQRAGGSGAGAHRRAHPTRAPSPHPAGADLGWLRRSALPHG